MEDGFFDLDHENMKIQVQKTTVQKQVLFRIVFPDNTKPLVICRAVNANGAKFWTCVPESVPNQIKAEKIGRLIEIYYRANYKR